MNDECVKSLDGVGRGIL